MDYQTYNLLSTIFYISGAVLLVLSIVLFFVLRIPFNIGYVTNYSKRKGVKLIKQKISSGNASQIKNNAELLKRKSEDKAYKKAKTTSDLIKTNENITNPAYKPIAATSKMTNDVQNTKLQKNKNGLLSMNKNKNSQTSIVSQIYDGSSDYVFPFTNPDGEFRILQEFSFTSSNEIII